MSEMIKHLTYASFAADIAAADRAVLVDCWAEWCGPCRQMMPMLDELTEEYAGRLAVAKLNVDENQEVAEALNVRGLPTFILFKQGTERARFVGTLSKTRLVAFLDTHL